MAKITVTGFVGPAAITKDRGSDDIHRQLRALRTYIEDRIESHFDALANLAISDSGTIHIQTSGDSTPEINKQLLDFATECIREFAQK